MSARTRTGFRAAAPRHRSAVPERGSFLTGSLVPIGLAFLCLAIYWNSFPTGFALDNRQLILNDPRVHALTHDNLSLILSRTYWWPYGESGLYRPLTTFSYLFNFAVLGNGDRPAGYHWVNLLFHIANVLLFWRVALRVTGDQWSGAVAAALWAALPLSTEAVTNIVGRADLMATTGTFVAVLLYLNVADGRADTIVSGGGVAAALLFGVLSKESAVSALGVLVVIELLHWKRDRSLRTMALVGGLCLVPLAWWLWQRHAVLALSLAPEFPFTDNPIVGAPFWQGRLTAIQVAWRYVALMLWPAHLSNDYSFAQIPLAQGTPVEWIAALLLAGGTVAALWQMRANRPALFFAAFALVTFLPVSNLIVATGTIMGERLVYLPSAGLAALLVLALRSQATTHRRQLAATAVAAALVVACGARTLARNPDWTNDVTLWRSAVAAAPASAKAHRALAEALYDTDPTHANIDAVIAEADRSVALLEVLPDEQNTFQAFRQAGAYYLDKANAVTPDAGSSSNAELKRLYSRALNLLDRAVVIARAGASRIPGGSTEPEADAQRLRAVAMLGLENPSLALTAADRARELQPFHSLGYRLAASALLGLDRADEAAMMLLTGSIVSGDPALGQEAMALYRRGLDTEGCAVTGSGATSALNPHCGIVVRHSCIASAAAYQILTRNGRQARGEEVKASAIANLGCPADLMDRPNSLVR